MAKQQHPHTVEMIYPNSALGAHQLTIKGTGNDAVMAAATLAIHNREQGITAPPTIRIWWDGSPEPSKCGPWELLTLALQLLLEEDKALDLN